MAFLREGEKLILQDRAKSDYFGKGTMYLTDSRFVFEVMTGGILSKTPEMKIDQPLGAIQSVSAPDGKTLMIQFAGSVEPTKFHTGAASKWEAAIRSALAVGGKT